MKPIARPGDLKRYLGSQLGIIESTLQPAVDALRARGFDVVVELNDPVLDDRLTMFENEFALTLPQGFKQLFLASDGFVCEWEDANLDDGDCYVFPSLYDLRLACQRWRNGEKPDRETLQDVSEENLDRLLESMEHWVPFEDHGNGDLTCVDCGTGKIMHLSHSNPASEDVLADDIVSYLRLLAAGQFGFFDA